MNRELQAKLYAKYPNIFVDKDADMRTTAMCWGIECDDGWYCIIDALCENIQKLGYNIKATQVKEKFGTLRFYTDYSNDTIDNLIELTENCSAKTCEVCGNSGQIMSTSGNWYGWLKTLCEDHAKKLKYLKIEDKIS